MAEIILTTLNAKYIHSAFGLRYLYANLAELQNHAELIEFNISQRPIEIVEKLLEHKPKIIGFGVYIWNVEEISKVVNILKQIAPEIFIVLGGPEVSFPPDLPNVVDKSDFIITGAAELSFLTLCRALLTGNKPQTKIIAGESVALENLKLPYEFYTEEDIKQRIVYVEASRGCPFKCEFCLSALDKSAKPFEIGVFLEQMDFLYQRGARHFKFIDRTFNLKVDSSIAILEFFLARLTEDLYLHFEVIPDNLPERLKTVIQKFPAGRLQFEVGVQSFDPKIQQIINRKQDNEKTQNNLLWLRQNSATHIHADLIIGLPGDSMEGFGKSFDRLVSLEPQEIQVGILKRLRGAPINQHTEAYQMRYDPDPPYSILSTRDIGFADMQRLNRFARFWDMIGNSGRFKHTLPEILLEDSFKRFLELSDTIYSLTDSTWKISLKRLFELVYMGMTQTLYVDSTLAEQLLYQDFLRNGEKSPPEFLRINKVKDLKKTVPNKRQRTNLVT